MKKNSFVILSIVIVLLVFVSGMLLITRNKKLEKSEKIETPKDEPATSIKLNYDDVNFSFQFLKMENKKENMVYSPLSIKYALQMLNDGASGDTKSQIKKAIQNTNLGKYNNINNVLSLANALYIKKSYANNIKDEYSNNLVSKYNAEIKYDNFKSAKNVNNWIENKTFGQIKNLLQDSVVTNPDNKMFLINALAIDMAWKNSFEEKNTHGKTFYLENNKEMNATTMNKKTKSDDVAYYQDDSVTVLTMDLEKYEDNQMEFVAIMPNGSLSDYIENIQADTLESITNKLKLASETPNGLSILVPRFSYDYKLELESDLKKLGIVDAFNKNLADFSNMTDKKPFWVGGALHKANIDFSEKGVKAAAATVIYVTDGIEPSEDKPVVIEINKPFMYLIKDKNTNEIWFVGTVYKPNSWDNDKKDYQYK